MRSIFKYCLFCLLVLLVSCGVKKNVTISEQAGNTTVPDTLPDFLREFANDSTSHINWVYGIPFIIDDSVPMFLPPIDPNPEGYTSNKLYQQRGENRFQDQEVLGLHNPIDSILWLNKCLNDLENYVDSSFFAVSHSYVYTLHLFLLDDGTYIFVFHVTQTPQWACMATSLIAKQTYLYNAYDFTGNLIGKSYLAKPIEWKNGVQIDNYDWNRPASNSIFSLIQQHGKRQILIRLVSNKEDPNCPSPCPYKV